MKPLAALFPAALLVCTALAPAAGAAEVTRFAVNEYFGIPYADEPVSVDVTLPHPTPASEIGLAETPSQVEIVEGTPEAVTKARVWTAVSFPFVEQEREVQKKVDGEKVTVTETVLVPGSAEARHKVLTVMTGGGAAKAGPSPFTVERHPAKAGEVPLATISNGFVHVRVPCGSVRFDAPVRSVDVPGPVASISRDGKQWIGRGYLDTMRGVRGVECQWREGPVYVESRLAYAFEGDRTYRVRVRLYRGKPYVQLVGDFDLGRQARFIFNYEDWVADGFFRTGDQRLYGWERITSGNPCGDFVTVPGQRALARMVIWTQFNYFGGKQETIALKAPDPEAHEAGYREALTRYERDVRDYATARKAYDAQVQAYKDAMAGHERDLAAYEAQLKAHEKDPKAAEKPTKPREPREPKAFRRREPRKPTHEPYEPITAHLAGAPYPAATVVTPGSDATAVGAFYVRPDRWTRAKVNHVDLMMRPEVPGRPLTRGQVGLTGAKARVAMEAWLVDGHREWAIFAVASGDREWLAKAHVREGAWPLDRLLRTPLVWNSDGTPVAPQDTRPSDDAPAGGDARRVLMGMGGRSGLQAYNGSNGDIRGTSPPREGWDGSVEPLRAAGHTNRMAGEAITPHLAADDSAYPSVRAMLPWQHPEALNPFYQGMENMNFNADLYRYICKHGMDLARMGHPEARRFIDHAITSLDMALDRYCYPQSGCWEESHGYAGHTMNVLGPMALSLRNSGLRDFTEDLRFARMMAFYMYVHSPVDPAFGGRIVPPIGDHGLSKAGPASRFGRVVGFFTEAKNPAIRKIVRQVAWMIREDGGAVPAGVEPERPDLTSRWLQGYGSVMRARADAREALVLTLKGAVATEDRGSKELLRQDLYVTLRPTEDGGWAEAVTGTSPEYNTARHTGTVTAGGAAASPTLKLDMTLADDKWVKGGPASYTVALRKQRAGWAGTYTGRFRETDVAGEVAARSATRSDESFLILRAGQSWGHHHKDKGSMWFWGRNVHFFGDCDWGGPPGGTYGNAYKQGPAGGTQIEMVGINNWPLPCKYPAPWVADDEYAPTYDYAMARCLYPYNPDLDLAASTRVALRQAYDRQVLFVHPDVVLVRDTVEATCPTVWRLHSYQPEGTTVRGPTATLVSPQGPTGHLAMLYPDGVTFTANDRDILNRHTDRDGKPLPHDELPTFDGSLELRWHMPGGTDATWAFVVRGEDEAAPEIARLDDAGRVTRVRLDDGTEIVALMALEPFTWQGAGVAFEGTVGLVMTRDGKTTVHPIRATRLEAR